MDLGKALGPPGGGRGQHKLVNQLKKRGKNNMENYSTITKPNTKMGGENRNDWVDDTHEEGNGKGLGDSTYELKNRG